MLTLKKIFSEGRAAGPRRLARFRQPLCCAPPSPPTAHQSRWALASHGTLGGPPLRASSGQVEVRRVAAAAAAGMAGGRGGGRAGQWKGRRPGTTPRVAPNLIGPGHCFLAGIQRHSEALRSSLLEHPAPATTQHSSKEARLTVSLGLWTNVYLALSASTEKREGEGEPEELVPHCPPPAVCQAVALRRDLLGVLLQLCRDCTAHGPLAVLFGAGG